MKVITKPDKPEEPFETGDFVNGNLYIARKPYRRGNRKDVYLYSCGMLIHVVEAHAQFNVTQCDMKRGDYVNVTTKFSLILNELYDNQKTTIDGLHKDLAQARHMLADWEQGERNRENQT